MLLTRIYDAIDALYSDTVETRRYLHQHPELSFQEEKTAVYIADQYEKLGIPYQKNVGGNGVVATLTGGMPGKTIALRADFDALPIQDEKDVPYKSTIPGVMHACGHDGHTATLLSIAKALVPLKEELPGTVIFLHQHAEESAPGGAKAMIEAGAISNADAVFGTHLWATTPVGVIQTAFEACMAGVDKFIISVQGQGGHGGYPHETKDAIVIGAQLVSELQQIVSRKINPMDTAVITIGEFKAGQAFNIIADKAEIVGTVRYLNQSVQKQIMKEMQRFIDGLAQAHDITCNLVYEQGYPPLINHKQEAKLVLEAASKIKEVTIAEEMLPNMAGEDFAYYVQEKPGAFFFTGAAPKGHAYPHHHPKFDIDEQALPIAAKALIAAYFEYQTAHPV